MGNWRMKQDWVNEAMDAARQAVRRELRGRPEEAEEAVQIFLAELIERRSPEDFPELRNLRAYAYRTARFRALSLLRRRRRASSSPNQGEERALDVADRDERAVGAAIERAEAIARLRETLALLTPDERLLMERSYFESLDDRQLAAR